MSQSESNTIDNDKRRKEDAWARIYSVSRADYVHLKVFACADAMERSGDMPESGGRLAEKRAEMEKLVLGYYGENAGHRIIESFDDAEKDSQKEGRSRDSTKIVSVARTANRHIRGLAYACPQITRTNGRASLDERLEMELAIFSWCSATGQVPFLLDECNVLFSNWISPDMLVSNLSPGLKDVVRPELEKFRRAIPSPDPEADPESCDMGDVFDVQTAIARTVLYQLLGENEELVEKTRRNAMGMVGSIRLKPAQDMIQASITRMKEPGRFSNLKASDVFSGKDWDSSFSKDVSKRLISAIDRVLENQDGRRPDLLDKDRETLFRRFGVIDSMYKGSERSESCQMAKLYVAIDMLCNPESKNRMIDELCTDGYLDDEDRSRLQGIGRAASERLPDADGAGRQQSLHRLRIARAGGMDNLQAGLAVQVSADVVDGRGDAYAKECSAFIAGARRTAEKDREGQKSNQMPLKDKGRVY